MPLAIGGALLAMSVLLADPVAAHLGRISYSDIQAHGDTLAYRLKFAVHLIPGGPPGQHPRWTRQDVVRSEQRILQWLDRSITILSQDRPCSPSIVDLLGPDRNDDLTVLLAYHCSGPIGDLRIEFRPFDDRITSFQNIVSVKLGNRSASYVFTPDNQVLSIKGKAAKGPPRFREFFVLGVEHIWSGYDHLLFLLALLLPGGTLLRIAGIVSAFTISHSITLSLAALGIVTLPPAPVEVGIAASIVWVAASGLIEKKDHRWPVTFAFGLIHGFGFAGVLRAAGIPSADLAVPLLAFNLGVEAGQLVVVTATVPLLRLLMRGRWARPIRLTLTWLVILAGTVWMVQRSVPLLGF